MKHDFKVNVELKSDSIWQVPEQGQQTQLILLLELTNQGSYPIRFPIMDKFKFSIEDSNGEEVQMEGGQDVLIPGKPITDPIPPNGKYSFEVKVHLVGTAHDHLQLSIEDGYGSIWWFGPLKTGFYKINAFYESEFNPEPKNHDLWFGKAKINPITIQIYY